jgi:hypothetical protein
MSKAILFLQSLEDLSYAMQVLGLPLELVPQSPRSSGHRKIQIDDPQDLESAYRELCTINTTAEFTALRP